MSIRKTVLSAAVLASLLVVNVAVAATATTTAAAPAATAPAAKMDMNTMRANKMAQRMNKELGLSAEETTKVTDVFKDMFDKADKFREDMDKDMMKKMEGALSTEHFNSWKQKHEERQKERMEKRSKKQQKMMQKQDDKMM